MAKVKHVSQFAHDIAVRVLERFDNYGVCEIQLARNADGRPVNPTSPDAACMCITGRIINAFPGADDDFDYNAPAVAEIARTITGGRTACPAVLYARNDRLFDEVGPEALKAHTRRLFERIAALPVVDENPTEYRVGGVYQDKDFSDGPEDVVTVARILQPGEHTRPCHEAIAEYTNGEYDRLSFIKHYRRVR